jgi:hypothetical protein
MADGNKPVDDDIRFDDEEFNPNLKPGSAKAWLNLLEESETAFERWHLHCDNIDKIFASLERLSVEPRQRQFQMFWSNCEVLKPAIYARPPVPVVVPKFKDRRPIYQAASEVLERCAVVAFDLAAVDDTMKLVRDDVALVGRGVPWCRYESGDGESHYSTEKVCIEFKHRRDFLHSISRCWYEVTWVAAASYLTRSEARERFHRHSADVYQDAEYKVDKDSKEIGGADNRERAKFWEIWDKTNRRVVWVSQGCEDILDEDEPHLDLENYFPCPRPAYGTLQRGSLVPVPDILQYKDQLDEINMLTGRIHALSDAIEAKGFYPAGSSELSDAIQTAVATKTPGRLLVPIKNWATFGGTKEVIVWLPIEAIAGTITALVALRKQVIEDVYQIMGLSDIMRGATDARETLGAQELKSQFGSSRIRDKQQEMVRIARDLVGISCEIVCERFDDETIIQMSQTQLPTNQVRQQQIMQVQRRTQQQMQQLQQQQMQQPGQQNTPNAPAPAPQSMIPQLLQEAQAEIEKIQAKPTIDEVLRFLRDNRARSFVLDIETDSTIMADENAEKQRRTEFVGMLGNLLPQLIQLVSVSPGAVNFSGEVLKFSVAPFRAGRSLDGAVDEFVEDGKATVGQQKPEDPATMQNKTALQIEMMKNERAKAKDQADVTLKAKELAMVDQRERDKIASQEKMKMADLMAKQGDGQQKAQETNLRMMHDRETHQAGLIETQESMRLNAQKMAMAQAAHQAKQADLAARAGERQAAQQMRINQPPRGFP